MEMHASNMAARGLRELVDAPRNLSKKLMRQSPVSADDWHLKTGESAL